ncbi:hypothetical protein KKC08_00740 [Patescibacteria group bacterium]|nr:hypothetical protein [Patescibacteria group bacterium]MCG2701911.1 hypothetical protein [Candidatus Parcubacteria bacterium]MBU4210396.1 hypothetical protein [Patescibacteria group bacterium]MBU4265195.1 hypothetical protein [Patescibacteria group bacterium]MBU4390759.1 hypothetical protein [Patescibacteria group bacterium]
MTIKSKKITMFLSLDDKVEISSGTVPTSNASVKKTDFKGMIEKAKEVSRLGIFDDDAPNKDFGCLGC